MKKFWILLAEDDIRMWKFKKNEIIINVNRVNTNLLNRGIINNDLCYVLRGYAKPDKLIIGNKQGIDNYLL